MTSALSLADSILHTSASMYILYVRGFLGPLGMVILHLERDGGDEIHSDTWKPCTELSSVFVIAFSISIDHSLLSAILFIHMNVVHSKQCPHHVNNGFYKSFLFYFIYFFWQSSLISCSGMIWIHRLPDFVFRGSMLEGGTQMLPSPLSSVHSISYSVLIQPRAASQTNNGAHEEVLQVTAGNVEPAVCSSASLSTSPITAANTIKIAAVVHEWGGSNSNSHLARSSLVSPHQTRRQPSKQVAKEISLHFEKVFSKTEYRRQEKLDLVQTIPSSR